MPRVQMSCPRCRQPIVAEIEQLFDVGADPEAKQRFLSGNFNVANCPSCGYQGPLSTPVVYHDPEKELLLTYFPPDLGIPVNDQERLIGPFITQVMNKLPAEKRKASMPPDWIPLITMITRNLGDKVEIRIQDNGTGMPESVKEKIFQPFFTTKPTGEGTGLGLSISYDIVVAEHKGTIRVESVENEGTEFIIQLPKK